MAAQTPPFVLQNASHGSELVRREALASLTYGSAGGVVPATPTASANLTAGVAGCSDLKVNAPASGMSCLVNAGQVYVPGSLGSGAGYGIGTGYGMPTVTLNGGAAPTVSSTAKAVAVQLTTQGMYYCYNDNSAGQVSLTVSASNATNPRIDVVVAQVEDASYSGAANDWKLAVVTGTPAASPTVPPLSANMLVLAYLWIPANSTSVTAGNILDLRVACNRNPFRCVYSRTGAWTTPSGVAAFLFDTAVMDLVGMYNAGTGVFTAPVSGLYLMQGQAFCTSSAAGQNLQFQTTSHSGNVIYATATGTFLTTSLSVSEPMQAAATATTQINSSTAGLTGGTGAGSSYFMATLLTPA